MTLADFDIRWGVLTRGSGVKRRGRGGLLGDRDGASFDVPGSKQFNTCNLFRSDSLFNVFRHMVEFIMVSKSEMLAMQLNGLEK